MSQYKEAEIGDTVYFWFAANTTAGAAGDGASPLFDVRLAGAAAGAAPTASGTPTLLTHADYTDGLHEIAIDTTGYSAGEYAVFCSLTISTVNPAGFCGSFRLKAAGASIHSATAAVVGDHGVVSIQDDVDAIKAKTDSLTFSVANNVDANTLLVSGLTPDDSADIAEAVRTIIVEGGHNLAQVLRAILSYVSGKADGGGTATLHFRSHADNKNRITLTVDADGNRSASVLDLTTTAAPTTLAPTTAP